MHTFSPSPMVSRVIPLPSVESALSALSWWLTHTQHTHREQEMQQTRIKDDDAEKVIPPSSIFDDSSVSSPDARKQAEKPQAITAAYEFKLPHGSHAGQILHVLVPGHNELQPVRVPLNAKAGMMLSVQVPPEEDFWSLQALPEAPAPPESAVPAPPISAAPASGPPGGMFAAPAAPVAPAAPPPPDKGGARSYGMQKSEEGKKDFSTIGQVHGGKTMAQAGGMGSAGGADVLLTNLSCC